MVVYREGRGGGKSKWLCQLVCQLVSLLDKRLLKPRLFPLRAWRFLECMLGRGLGFPRFSRLRLVGRPFIVDLWFMFDLWFIFHQLLITMTNNAF